MQCRLSANCGLNLAVQVRPDDTARIVFGLGCSWTRKTASDKSLADETRRIVPRPFVSCFFGARNPAPKPDHRSHGTIGLLSHFIGDQFVNPKKRKIGIMAS